MRILLTALAGMVAPLISCSSSELQTTGGYVDRWIEIIPLGDVSRETVFAVSYGVEEGLGVDVRLSRAIRDISTSYDSERGQYRADTLLNIVKERRDGRSLRSIGVIEADIYVKGLNYVFGVASEAAKCCLVSVARLKGEFWGMKRDTRLFLKRTKKLVLHELGHTFGLRHCKNDCVMVFANSLMQLDLSSGSFCRDCMKRLKEGIESGR